MNWTVFISILVILNLSFVNFADSNRNRKRLQRKSNGKGKRPNKQQPGKVNWNNEGKPGFTQELERSVGFVKYSVTGRPGNNIVSNGITIAQIQSQGSGKGVLDPDAQTKIFIHGFTGDCSMSDTFPRVVLKAFIVEGKYNFICLNYTEIASPHNTNGNPSRALQYYAKAAKYAPIAGLQLSKLINTLYKIGIVETPDDVHLIGYGLGAHIAGIAGSEAQKLFRKSVGRITGSDPAGEFYGHSSKAVNMRQLDPSDADFVEVTHTNGGQLGLLEDTGHVNFYVNGGEIQPHCLEDDDYFGKAKSKEEIPGLCSHAASNFYFARSILQDSDEDLTACKCSSWESFEKQGKHCKHSHQLKYGYKNKNKKASGMYCLEIN